MEYQNNDYGVGAVGKVVNVTADGCALVGENDMSLVHAIAFDLHTHGYYAVSERVGEAFKDSLFSNIADLAIPADRAGKCVCSGMPWDKSEVPDARPAYRER